MRLLLLADTHVPRRARTLPDDVWRQVDRADLVVHAGDWVVVQLLDELEQRASRLLAVHGNNDGADLRARLQEVAIEDLDGVRVGVVHETGPSRGRDERARTRWPELDLLVFGHSHIPWDSSFDGLRLLNPGSPTDRRRAPYCTYITLTLHGGAVTDVVLHELPSRERESGTPLRGRSASEIRRTRHHA